MGCRIAKQSSTTDLQSNQQTMDTDLDGSQDVLKATPDALGQGLAVAAPRRGQIDEAPCVAMP